MRIGAAEATVDFYAVLGIAAAASTAEIRRAHRRLARASHPDLARRACAEDEMKRVNIAASILLDPTARARYDLLRGSRKSARPGGARPFVPVSDASVAPTPAWRAKVGSVKSFWRTRLAFGFAAAFGVTCAVASVAAQATDPVPVASPRYRVPKPPLMTTMWVNE